MKLFSAREKERQRGFTMVELLVVLGIFTGIALLITSIFLFGIKEQRRAVATQEALNQVSFAAEFMVRAVRMAKEDEGGCVGVGRSYDVFSGGQGIRFRNALEDEDCQEFRMEEGALYYVRDAGQGGSRQEAALLSENMSVGRLQFVLSGDVSGDEQPRVTLMMEVVPDVEELDTFHIQTTVSQRDIEI